MRHLELVSVTGETIPLNAGTFRLSQQIVLAGLPRVTVASHPTLGSGGRRAGERRHETRDVPVRITVLAGSPDEFDDAIARLARAVDPVVGDVALRLHRADGTAREVVCTYVDGFTTTLRWAGSTATEVPLVFEAFDPYWRAAAESAIDILASEFIGGGEPTTFNSAAVAFNAAIPFNGFNESGVQEFIVEVGGDVEAWPRWDLTGPAEDVTVVNLTTGKLWSYTPALGGAVSEVQTVTITGTPAGGTFTLDFEGLTTGTIAYNAVGATVQTALEALATLDVGEVTVTGVAGGPYTVTFAELLGNVAQMTADDSGLTGGTAPAVGVVTTTPGHADGERLIVDTRPTVRQVTLDDVNAFGDLTDDSELWPLVPGTNHLSVRVQNWDATTSSSRLLLSWRERYLTP